MDAKLIKEKIISGQMSEKELSDLLNTHSKPQRKQSFLKTLINGYTEAYTVPNIYKTILEAILIFSVLIGAIVLSYAGKMENTITAVLFATVLGFLFGKIR